MGIVDLGSVRETNMKFLFILFCIQFVQGGTRDPKFSIFNVIRFKNNECTAQSNNDLKGICRTPEECGQVGGTNDGNCASGFGSCCVIYQRTCGSVDILRNGTYLVNPSYPGNGADTGRTCTYNVQTSEMTETICQLRLDFDVVRIATPNIDGDVASVTGTCTSDTIAATSPSGKSPPSYCGDISGTHMYVETARQSLASTITMTIGGDTFDRLWRIKVSYIGCWSNMRAPIDCQQYFTGVSGNVMSYGWTAQQIQVRNQEYFNCFRQEVGYCSIEYSVSNNAASPDYFALSGTAASGSLRRAPLCEVGGSVMFTAALSDQINSANDAVEYYCGNHFASMSGAMVSGAVRSDALPFNLKVVVGLDASNLVAQNVGFNINWRQVAC